MKGLLALFSVGILVVSGCAVFTSTPVFVPGFVFTDVESPLNLGSSQAGFARVGQSEATSILGWVAQGDCGIDAAAKSAGITKIHHVDIHTYQILGVWAKVTTTVYGE